MKHKARHNHKSYNNNTEQEIITEMQDFKEQDFEQILREALLRNSHNATPDVHEEWSRMMNRVTRRRHIRRMWYGAAVVAMLIAGAVFVAWQHVSDVAQTEIIVYKAEEQAKQIVVMSKENNYEVKSRNMTITPKGASTERQTVIVPQGKDLSITLADGSKVWLNSNSRMTYPTFFTGKTREVDIFGEAYLEVAHDDAHPFIVHSGNIHLKVLGTEFNINTYDEKNPKITLVKGSVRVSTQKSGNTLDYAMLHPNEAATLSNDKLQVGYVNINDEICWREGIELFDDESLYNVLLQMGSWYNMTVICHHEEHLNIRLHYVYNRNEDVGKAVKLLNKISKIKVNIKNNTIFVD